MRVEQLALGRAMLRSSPGAAVILASLLMVLLPAA